MILIMTILPSPEGLLFPYFTDNVTIHGIGPLLTLIVWTMVVSHGVDESSTWCPKGIHLHQFSKGGLVHHHDQPGRPEGGHAININTRSLWKHLDRLEMLEPLQGGAICNNRSLADQLMEEIGNGTLPMSMVYLIRSFQNDDLQPGHWMVLEGKNQTFQQLEWMAGGAATMTPALFAATLAKRGKRGIRTSGQRQSTQKREPA
jgi:hypothetical protein